MNKIKLMDCSLRDGSYVVNFQVSASDTAKIGGAIDELGMPYIEVGHGIGLGATENTKFKAASSDLEYLRAADQAIKTSKWGMFCIPGIASLDDLRLAADNGMDFIRIGTNVERAEDAIPYIELAKKLGLEVFANYMKSYVMPPKDFGILARRAYCDFGVDAVYIVDSAGGMLPAELCQYIRACKDSSDVSLGFHGHDNLGLSVANSLLCIEEGVEIIDTSFQGLGRSSGNAPTEKIIAAVERLGYTTGIDLLKALHVSEKYIREYVVRKGICSLDVIAGYAKFHTSYMPLIISISKEYQIDPRELIVKLCDIDKSNAPENLLRELAKKMSKTTVLGDDLPWGNYYGDEQSIG